METPRNERNEETMTEPGQGTLAQALVDAQAKMPNVDKDGTNPHYNSTFTSLDELISQTRHVLNDHGLVITQFPTVSEETGFPVLRTTLLHGPSDERMAFDTPLFLPRQDMQAFGAAVTYARRYAWAAVLGIAAESDDDGNTAGQAVAATAARGTPTTRMISDAQIRKIGALIGGLTENQTPVPDDYPGAESWVDVLKARLTGTYEVESRKQLSSQQASELIDWLELQAVPF